VAQQQVREGADGGAWLRFAGCRYAPSTLRCARPHRRGKDLRVLRIVARRWRSRGNSNCR
jgi:hypothetical protein